MTSITLASSLVHIAPPAQRRSALPWGAVALAHMVILWALVQSDQFRVLVREVRPLMVALINDVAPPAQRSPAPALRPLPLPQAPPVPLAPWPAIMVAPTPPTPQAWTAPAPAVAAQAASAAPLAVVAPAPPATPASAAPRTVAASAIRYRMPPAIEVPLASRRLGESGTVLLRVRVDSQGLPMEVLVHRSSGFARLDEQAVAAMRQARFQPQTDHGVAVDWQVFAPLVYELD